MYEPRGYCSLAAGSHTFQVRAIDGAGNVDPSPASFTWTVDLIAPDTTLTSTPPNPSNSASASFSFSASEAGSTFACQLDGAGFTACSSPKAYSSLAPGSHTFQVRATDGAGNVDPSPASFTWTIDLTAPDTTLTSSPANPSNSASASFSFTATEGGSTLRVQAGRRDVRCLHQPAALLRARRRQPYLPGPGHRRRQQRRPLAGQLHVDRRSERPGHHADEHAAQPEQQRRRASASPPRKPAAPSSASSTPGRSAPVPARSPTPGSPTAAIPSRSGPPMAPEHRPVSGQLHLDRRSELPRTPR